MIRTNIVRADDRRNKTDFLKSLDRMKVWARKAFPQIPQTAQFAASKFNQIFKKSTVYIWLGCVTHCMCMGIELLFQISLNNLYHLLSYAWMLTTTSWSNRNRIRRNRKKYPVNLPLGVSKLQHAGPAGAAVVCCSGRPRATQQGAYFQACTLPGAMRPAETRELIQSLFKAEDRLRTIYRDLVRNKFCLLCLVTMMMPEGHKTESSSLSLWTEDPGGRSWGRASNGIGSNKH